MPIFKKNCPKKKPNFFHLKQAIIVFAAPCTTYDFHALCPFSEIKNEITNIPPVLVRQSKSLAITFDFQIEVSTCTVCAT